MSDSEYFQKNPDVKRLALDTYFKEIWDMYLKEICDKVPARAREEILAKEFDDADKKSLGLFMFYLLKYLK